MKIIHVISGGETGGSRKHVISLLSKFPKEQVCLIVFQDGKLLNEARSLGISTHLIPQSSRYDLTALNKLANLIKSLKVDIVHSHGPRANLYLALIKKKFKAIWVTTIHSDPKLDFVKGGIKGFIFTHLNLWSIKKIDYFFAVSERFAENLNSLGVKKSKIKTIYNGIDFSVSEHQKTTLTRADLQLNNEDLVVAMVARLHPIKGHRIVFKALYELKNPKVKLLLVGDGPIEDDLKKEVVNLGLQNQIKFLGYRNDVESLFTLSDIGLLFSYSESFPLVLLEAAKTKTSVITSDVGGVNHLIVSPEMGWVLKVGDQQSLKETFFEALQKENAELKQMGQLLYNYASSNFSLEHLYIEMKGTYLQLIKRN